MGGSIHHLQVVKGGGAQLIVEKQAQRVPFHAVHIKGDDWDATDRISKPLLPPVPPPFEVDKLGGELGVGEGQGQLLVLSTQVAGWSVCLKPGSQGGKQFSSFKSSLRFILREDDELLVL